MPKEYSPRKFNISDDELIRMYSVDLTPVQEIAAAHGVTRQTVWHRVKRLGLTSYKRKTQHIKCENCGEMYDRWPSQGAGKFCSRHCYFEATSLYGDCSKAGQQQGRKVAKAQEGEVVHHIDGNTFNNVEGNLVVFRSHAQHCSFHKSGAAAWLKDKVARRQVVLTEVTHWPDGGKW